MNNKLTIKILPLLFALICTLISFVGCDTVKECKHDDGAWVVDLDATYESEGKRHKECTLCGETIQNEIIPIKICTHENSKWITDIEATYDNDGCKHLECNTCGKTIKTEVIPELYLTESEVTAKLKPSVVKVICYDYDGETEISQGSGFFIDSKGTFITNAHVVKDCFYIKVKTSIGLTYDVDVMYKYNGTTSDYAICKAKNCFSSKAVEFTNDVAVGDTIYALGYPNDAYIMSTTSGKITSTDVVDGTKHYYANTAWIDHGSSGGILADDKGRVLGITTGVFSDGEYAALKYQDFKSDAEGVHVGRREPLEWFHTVKEYDFSSYSMSTYFDIDIEVVSYTDTSVRYRVWVGLKDEYLNNKILLDTFGSATITIKLKTEYDYYEVKSYGSSHKTDTTSDTVYLYFNSVTDLKNGVSGTSNSSIYISYRKEYYGMEISYDADFGILQLGTIVIYD